MDVYERLNKLIAAITCESKDINTLSKELEIPSNVIQMDIDKLFESKEKSRNTGFYYIDIQRNNDKYYINKNLLTASILNNDSIYHDRYADTDSKLFSLNRVNYKLYKAIDKLSYEKPGDDDYVRVYHQSIKNNGIFLIKSTYDDSDSYITSEDEIANRIETARKNKAMLTITYKSKYTDTIMPHYLKRDINTNQLYVIELNDNYKNDVDPYSTPITSIPIIFGKSDDAIETVEITKKSWDYDPTEEQDKLIEYFWSYDETTLLNDMTGIEYDNPPKKQPFEGKPQSVKVWFFNSTNNIIDKIQRITEMRKYANLDGPFTCEKKLYDASEYYIYSDTILGMDSFKHWLKQYGSAAVVVEPIELAKEIYLDVVARTHD